MDKTTIIATLVMIATGVQQGQSNPAIGFSAGISKDVYLGDKQAIKYDRVLTNVGNGYDKWSGHFRAPIRGLYVFSCTVMAVNKGNIQVVLMKNGQRMAYAWSDSTPWETGAITIVLTLKKGDKVWIKRGGHGRTIHGNYNWFSGYLISTRV